MDQEEYKNHQYHHYQIYEAQHQDTAAHEFPYTKPLQSCSTCGAGTVWRERYDRGRLRHAL
eukprot:9258074-Karenia_brevis.AAC.1